MFEQFRRLFASEESLFDSAYDTTLKMLEYDSEMFKASKTALRDSDGSELPFDVKKMDRKINKYEREVRRNILTHLAVMGSYNLAPGLALVSIVIDVERIGDFTKNIVDLARQHEKPLKGGMHEDTLAKLETLIEQHFVACTAVLRENDQDQARKVMQVEQSFGKTAEEIMVDMIHTRDKDMPAGDAVCIALYARYLKRVNAHLSNIASAVANPFPRISFRNKSLTDIDLDDIVD